MIPDNKYGDAAQWFLTSKEFWKWCDLFLPVKVQSGIGGTLKPSSSLAPLSLDRASEDEQTEPPNDLDSKRVLWVRGGYGTGKTTLFYHAHNALVNSLFFQLVGTELRVISYFCDAGKTGGIRPDHETILRTLICHISLMPNFRMAEPAQALYHKFNNSSAPHKGPIVTEWENLFKDIVFAGTGQYHFVFVVDALDECESLPEAERFLEFMSEVMRDNRNVSFLCSSHQQVRVWRYFGKDNKYYGQDILEELEISEKATSENIEKFVDGEIARREKSASESAFCKYPIDYCSVFPTDIAPDRDEKKDLRKKLLTTLKRKAQGMFRWVQVWFDILLPPRSEDLPVLRKSANEWLDKLEHDVAKSKSAYELLTSGYQRLWDFNKNADYDDDVRKRLFHIVLCVLVPLTPEALTTALRIQGTTYDTDLTTKTVQRMYANFLVGDTRREGFDESPVTLLRFVHASARTFVASIYESKKEFVDVDISTAQKLQHRIYHKSFVEIYIGVVGNSKHPFWKAVGADTEGWRSFNPTDPKKEANDGPIANEVVSEQIHK